MVDKYEDLVMKCEELFVKCEDVFVTCEDFVNKNLNESNSSVCREM